MRRTKVYLVSILRRQGDIRELTTKPKIPEKNLHTLIQNIKVDNAGTAKEEGRANIKEDSRDKEEDWNARVPVRTANVTMELFPLQEELF